jgi:hypothetical protein
VPPHHVQGGGDLERRQHLRRWRVRTSDFDPGQQGQRYENHRDPGSAQAWPSREGASQEGAHEGHHDRGRRGHQEAKDAFEREKQDGAAGAHDGQGRHAQGRAHRPRRLEVEHVGGGRAHDEWSGHEEYRAVLAERHHAHADHQDGDGEARAGTQKRAAKRMTAPLLRRGHAPRGARA